MTEQDAEKKYGLNPLNIGNRYRGYWIVETIEEEEMLGGAMLGDLCVKTRDGGGNPMDAESCKYNNFRGTAQDGFDYTYRYYYYAPLGDSTDRGER